MLSARFGRPAEGMGGNSAAGIARGERAPDAPAGKVRVVIGSSVRLYREGLARALGSEHGVEVVGSAPSPGDILAVVVDTRPDVVLLDMAMEADPGFVRGLLHRIPAPVVVLGVEDKDVLAWAESGGAGRAGTGDPDPPASGSGPGTGRRRPGLDPAGFPQNPSPDPFRPRAGGRTLERRCVSRAWRSGGLPGAGALARAARASESSPR